MDIHIVAVLFFVNLHNVLLWLFSYNDVLLSYNEFILIAS